MKISCIPYNQENRSSAKTIYFLVKNKFGGDIEQTEYCNLIKNRWSFVRK